MTLSIEVPAALEANLRTIPDLPERVQSFLQHQASLEAWREQRRDSRITQLRDTIYGEARALRDGEVPREVIGRQLLEAYDRLCQQHHSHK